MQRLPQRFWVHFACAGTVLLAILLNTGCGSPCGDLSKKICGCKTTTPEQQACTQNVDSQSGAVHITSAQQDTCSQLLDTCTCDKLQSGDFAACGLAKE